MVLAVEKGIDSAHGKSDVRPRASIRNTLTEGVDRVIEIGPEGSVIRRGLAWSFSSSLSSLWDLGLR